MRKRITYFLPIVLFLFFLSLKIFYTDIYNYYIQEDRIVENLQVVAFLLSSFIFLKLAIKEIKNNKLFSFFFFIAFLGLFFIAGEEISWGQRILGFETPSQLAARNSQNELTIHNIDFIHKLLHYLYILIGLVGGGAWIIIPRNFLKKTKILRQFIPPWQLSFYFLLTAFIYFAVWIVDIRRDFRFIYWKDQEVGELFLSFGFLLYAWLILKKQRLQLKKS
jgi:hypothetical protein